MPANRNFDVALAQSLAVQRLIWLLVTLDAVLLAGCAALLFAGGGA